MKKFILFALLSVYFVGGYSQVQNNYGVDLSHTKHANLTTINDGSGDIAISSNIYDDVLQTYQLSVKRIDPANNIVWSKTYESTILSKARVFDIEGLFDYIYVTGTVEDGGLKKAFVARIEAFTGDLTAAVVLDIHDPTFNSTGLKLLGTSSDATGDGNANFGVLLTGYYSTCPTFDISCAVNKGFAVRLDFNLNTIWSIDMYSAVPGSPQQYNFINGATETSDGFILTGSATGETSIGQIRQAVLAHKVDFEGNSMWDNSYIYGNSNDISVDAYYDQDTEEVFMLVNYSNTHHFAVTALENATGNIIPAKSWYAMTPTEGNFYGFSLLRSASNVNNLIITGYAREYWDGVHLNNTNVFILEFEKADGNIVGDAYVYEVFHQDVFIDEYDFWFFQMPLVYYPDISILHNDGNSDFYISLGYRTNADGLTETEFFKTSTNKQNECDNSILNLNIQPQSNIEFISTVFVGFNPSFDNSLSFNEHTISFNEGSCSSTVFAEEIRLSNDAVFPNPASDIINVSDSEISKLEIIDYTGKVLMSKSLKNNNQINISHISDGLYLINLHYNDGKIKTKRFVKQ